GARLWELQAKLGDALANCGHGADAAAAYLAAAGLTGGRDSQDFRAKAANQFLLSGHVQQGLDTFAAVLAEVNLPPPRSGRGAVRSLVWQRLRLWARGLDFTERSAAELPQDELRRIDLAWSVASGLAVMDTVRSSYFQAIHMRL